jgi:hypothetical protein
LIGPQSKGTQGKGWEILKKINIGAKGKKPTVDVKNNKKGHKSVTIIV